MRSKTSTKWYFCKYCNQRHKSFAMALICFDLDMKILKFPKDEKKVNKPVYGSK